MSSKRSKTSFYKTDPSCAPTNLYLYHNLYLNLCALPERDEDKDYGKDKEEQSVLPDLWVIESPPAAPGRGNQSGESSPHSKFNLSAILFAYIREIRGEYYPLIALIFANLSVPKSFCRNLLTIKSITTQKRNY